MSHRSPYNSGVNRQDRDCCTILCQCCSSIPFCTRFIWLTVTSLSILGQFYYFLPYEMMNAPYYVIWKSEFHRIFTSPWICLTIWRVVIGGWMFLLFMPGLERQIGSAKFFFRYIVLGFVYELTYVGMAYLLFKVHIWVRVDAGFFFAYFIEFCAYCFRNPTARVRYCMLWPCQAIFVPFIPIIICIVYEIFPLRYLICILFGFLDSKDWLKFLEIPGQCALQIDRTCFNTCAYFSSYVKASSSLQFQTGFLYNFFRPRVRANQGQWNQDQNVQQPQASQNPSGPFQGRGISLQQAAQQAQNRRNAGRVHQSYYERAHQNHNFRAQQESSQNKFVGAQGSSQASSSDHAIIEMENRGKEGLSERHEDKPTGMKKGPYHQVKLDDSSVV